MAAGSLPAPGKSLEESNSLVWIGPCIKPCDHIACAQTRMTAEALCDECKKPIGYETMFYAHQNKTLSHAICLEEASVT